MSNTRMYTEEVNCCEDCRNLRWDAGEMLDIIFKCHATGTVLAKPGAGIPENCPLTRKQEGQLC